MADTPWTIESIPAFCITLKRRPDRWKRFQDHPGTRPLSIKRFLGIDGKTIDVTSDHRIATLAKRNIITHSRRSHEELDSIGGIGCALSHIAVWQWMVDHQEEKCLVFEDDAVVPSDFTERANATIRTSLLRNKGEWDIWLLGGVWDDLTSIPNETSQSGLLRIGSFVLFHAYVMTLPTAKRLLQTVYPIQCHIDMWVSVEAHLTHLRMVGTPRLRLQQNPKASTDIQSEEGCTLCNVPTDFQKTHRLVSHEEWYMARTAEMAILVLLCYGAYRLL